MSMMSLVSHAMVLAANDTAKPGLWENILVPNITLVEKMLRPIFVYFFLIIGLRAAGKRELAQLNPFDLIVLLTLSNTVQNAIIGDDNSVSGGFIGAATLLALNYLVVRVVRHSKVLQHLLEGRSDVLIAHGKVLKSHLGRELMTRSDLQAAAHKQGIASLNDVERCVLEPTGTITFIQKEPTQEVQRHQALLAKLSEIQKELVEMGRKTDRA